MSTLSIIVVSYNTRELLRSCLASIFEHAKEENPEVIVVDNNSSDGSVDVVRSVFPRIKVIANEENRGFAAANNIGVRIATGEMVLLLNPDTELLPQSVSSALTYMRNNSDVGILGCRILSPDGTVQQSARDVPSLWTLLMETSFLYKVLPHSGLFRNPWVTLTDQEQDVDVVKGAFLLTRRSIFEAVGYLDEQFFLYSEEQDWCVRVKRHGWRIVYYPAANIIHREGASSKPGPDSTKYMVYDSEFLYFVKYHGKAYAMTALLLMWIGILLRLVVWAFLAMVRRLGISVFPEASSRTIDYWYTLVRLTKRLFRPVKVVGLGTVLSS
jgi:GT2 family glycosyltransferase